MPKSRNTKKGAVFDPKEFVRPGLTAAEVSEIKEAFDYFDEEKSGEMSVKELLGALKKYGFDKQNPEIFEVIAELDAEGIILLLKALRWWLYRF